MMRVRDKKWIIVTWYLASSLVFSWCLLGPLGDYFRNLFVRGAFFGLLVALSMLLLRKTWKGFQFWRALVATVIIQVVFYQVFTFLPGVNNHPFTLTWSEGSAYYFASLYFSEEIYGVSTALPLINPTRHFLMAIPFVISDLPIWVHRLWEVILWLVVTGSAVYLLVRRLGLSNQLLRWMIIGWVFLFFFQGPVYYFLLISIIPVLWGFDGSKFTRTLLLVLVGSAWAGVSRVNWFPVPALLAATLYFLEIRVDQRSWFRYLAAPAAWFALGVSVALLSWFSYAQFSGQPPDNFGIYFTSHLLWYRLLPNATYPGGVLPMSLLASLPLLGVISVHMYRSGFNFHLIRRLGVAAILFVLFIGGLFVSTKIGGGNNIHNLDAYLIILLITGSYLYFGKAEPDFEFPARVGYQRLENVFIFLAVLVPVFFSLQQGGPKDLPDQPRTENALLTIQEYALETVSKGGKVLFLTDRQLLTFGAIEGVRMLPEYERMKLMEMVMGGNQSYLAKFQQRIKNQEYDLIISEPLDDTFKGPSAPFGDEHDVYVEQVSLPILCYYEPVKDIFKFPIQLLAPVAAEETCSSSQVTSN